MDTKIVPITDFVRKFGMYADLLPSVNELVLTRGGRPFATVKATPEEKNRELLACAGIWKGTKLDNDTFWKKARTRKNRRKLISFP